MHASYAAKVHVLHGEKLGNTYHSKNCFVVGGAKAVPTPEQTAELRAKWVAIGGSPKREPKPVVTVEQSQIIGTRCSRFHMRCEYLEWHVKHPCKCGWYGDDLKRSGKSAVRLENCQNDKEVPPKADDL